MCEGQSQQYQAGETIHGGSSLADLLCAADQKTWISHFRLEAEIPSF
jgi:hypothetical protein